MNIWISGGSWLLGQLVDEAESRKASTPRVYGTKVGKVPVLDSTKALVLLSCFIC